MRMRSVLQAMATLLLVGAPAWAVAANNAAPAAPGNAAVAPPQAAPRPAVASAMAPLETAYAESVALLGAIALRDWDGAGRHLAMLRGQQKGLTSLGVRDTRLTPLIGALSVSVPRRDAVLANEQAYRAVTVMLAALDQRAIVGGGGGGAAAAMGTSVAALEHLRQASQAAAQVQLHLLGRDNKAAKASLDTVREELKSARRGTSDAVMRARLDDLDRRRWRTVAALADPPRAYGLSSQLSHGFALTLRRVGRMNVVPAGGGAGTGGGGGGGAAPARPILQDAPQPTHAHAMPIKQSAIDDVPYDKQDI